MSDEVMIPFEKTDELCKTLADTVPGQPLIRLTETGECYEFLTRELSTKRLVPLYSILFLLSNRNNISPLHHQAVKGRQIIITERPDLHLVWYSGRIFIKPIPVCLLNYDFYRAHVLVPFSDCDLHKEARGFLRTYARLIIHESDFNIAKTINLIPDNVDWSHWCRFIRHIQELKDSDVSPRYHYGELRLTRLNFYSKLLLNGWSYFEVYYQYTDYFARFLAPYLFMFGATTLVLAAMQTAITADSDSPWKSHAAWFSLLSVTLTCFGVLFFPMLYILFQLRELLLFIFYYQLPK